jgi:biotin operon repressor
VKSSPIGSPKSSQMIITIVSIDAIISLTEIAKMIGISRRVVAEQIAKLK